MQVVCWLSDILSMSAIVQVSWNHEEQQYCFKGVFWWIFQPVSVHGVKIANNKDAREEVEEKNNQ